MFQTINSSCLFISNADQFSIPYSAGLSAAKGRLLKNSPAPALLLLATAAGV
jgi:hypothetical protein